MLRIAEHFDFEVVCHPGGGGGTRSEKGYQLWSDRRGAVAVAPRDG